MVLSERIIAGCNSKHSCSPHSQQVSGMNRGFLFEQLSLMGSSSFPETWLTASRTSLGLPCLSNAACVSRLSQRSASPQGSSCDPHPLLCLFLINMDYLFGCGKDHSIEKSKDHPTSQLQDSHHRLFSKHSGGSSSPLLSLAASIGQPRGGTLPPPCQDPNQPSLGESRVRREGK